MPRPGWYVFIGATPGWEQNMRRKRTGNRAARPALRRLDQGSCKLWFDCAAISLFRLSVCSAPSYVASHRATIQPFVMRAF